MQYVLVILGLLQFITILLIRYIGKWLVPRPYGKELTGIARYPLLVRLLLWLTLGFSLLLIFAAYSHTLHGWWFLGASLALFILFAPPLKSFVR